MADRKVDESDFRRPRRTMSWCHLNAYAEQFRFGLKFMAIESPFLRKYYQLRRVWRLKKEKPTGRQ